MVGFYNGQILDNVDGEIKEKAYLPDSFSMRLELSGKGLKDLALNYPFIFEILEPEDLFDHEKAAGDLSSPDEGREIHPPAEGSPAVCIIDSGIQEGHRLIAPALDSKNSRCFIPGKSLTEVGDYADSGGHGTRVAGAVLFPGGVNTAAGNDPIFLPFWIQNARVLDEDLKLSDKLFPPLYLRRIVDFYQSTEHRTRIFNHSIGSYGPCRTRHMSIWAAEIDLLSFEKDIIFIQAAGNLPDESNHKKPSVRVGTADHLNAGREYPSYLFEDSARISNPAQSFQAITVGSVSLGEINDGSVRSIASKDRPSAFTTSGLGIWKAIKPDVVEYGGDIARSITGPPYLLSTPPEVCPDLVRSSYKSPGPEHGRDDVGTSFAAPKVAHVAAAIQEVLPNEPCLLYRALIAQSARWPEWTSSEDGLGVLRTIGFGVPDAERATTNSPYRVTLITKGEQRIGAKVVHIYRIPVPAEMRAPGTNYDMRLDITLSYAAKPRRTRRNVRNYLSTWVDWKSSKMAETFESFRNRVARLPESPLEEQELDGEGEIPWFVRERDDWGNARGVRRGVGTLQKDWAFLKSFQIPVDFCVAVVGHPGWEKGADAYAKYSLAVSFEIISRDIEIYSLIQQSIEIPSSEVRSEVEISI